MPSQSAGSVRVEKHYEDLRLVAGAYTRGLKACKLQCIFWPTGLPSSLSGEGPSDMLGSLLLLLVLVSWLYWLIACWRVRAHFRTREEFDLLFLPPVSILKPVRGLDAGAYQNFASFCRQDYPEFELLFGVSDPADPAIPIVERLQRDFSEHAIRLVVTQVTEVNRKAGLLHVLATQAGHEVIVVSDSDMRVSPDYLSRVVAPLADKQVGLVTCSYRGEAPLTLTARLEALYLAVTFLPSVLVARKFLDMRFALGATMVLRRGDLARIGSFAAVADYLADDYQLGLRVALLGLRVHLSDYVVPTFLGATTFREQWHREVRWAQCSRVSRPLEYPGLLITFSTPLALALALVTGFAPIAWLSLIISLLLRWMVAWLVTGYIGDQTLRRWLIWLPVRDLLSALIWCAGAMGRRVVWRGEKFLLATDGRLEAVPPSAGLSKGGRWAPLLGRLVRGLDPLLRRYLHIYEFSQDEECLFRLAIRRSANELTLSDGTRVSKWDTIGELHLWNEHIPLIPEEGPNLAWALAFQRRLSRSFGALAAYVESDSQLHGIQAFRGQIFFGGPYELAQMTHMAEHWGFDLVTKDDSDGLWRHLVGFGENVYSWGLIWAFNPTSAKGRDPRRLRRDELWISRRILISKYGDPEHD